MNKTTGHPTLTKAQAIRECKALWEAIDKSGLSKEDFFNTAESAPWQGKYQTHCPLYEYATQRARGNSCDWCPLPTNCYDLGFEDDKRPSQRWLKVIRAL